MLSKNPHGYTEFFVAPVEGWDCYRFHYVTFYDGLLMAQQSKESFIKELVAGFTQALQDGLQERAGEIFPVTVIRRELPITPPEPKNGDSPTS